MQRFLSSIIVLSLYFQSFIAVAAGPVIWKGTDAALINSGTLVDKRGIPYIQDDEKNYIKNK